VHRGGLKILKNSSRAIQSLTDLRAKNITFLGVGPMSNRVVDETIALANRFKKTIALIPSRRQVECAELGGGYVNSWTTESFTDYVRKADKYNNVLLSRDHSGPWQFKSINSNGQVMAHQEAISEVKISLKADIDCGFDLIHIDPSLGISFGRSEAEVIEDIIELIDFCVSLPGGRNLSFEVGADEQSMHPDLPSLAEYKIARIIELLKDNSLPIPLFYVLQTGTKVKEMRNIGSFATHVPVRDMLSPMFQIPEIMKLCKTYNVFLKEHNADYLPEESLRWHRRLAIPAANVAPEFGVVETKSILRLAIESSENWFVELFSETVIDGGKWQKWMLDTSQASDLEKVQIAGHYHFADINIQDAMQRLQNNLFKKHIDLEKIVRSDIRLSIERYLFHFGYYE
jgi:hypothetical protein